MTLRLIEMIVPEPADGELQELLAEQAVMELNLIGLLNGEVLVRILLMAEKSEAVLDILEKQYSDKEDYRIVVLPVEATLPRIEIPEADEKPAQESPPEEKTPERISRHELYEDISEAARFSKVYFAMVVLSAIVATIGLEHNSVAIVIGAMVIAPLLGPNVALALATTLGDLPLAKQAALSAIAGIATVTVMTLIIGALLHVDPTLSQLASRTQVGLSDVVLALAAGCAGALAFTTGVSAILVGVMVAVALLPPMVTFGLLLGGGQIKLAMGALSLLLANLICLNLAAVLTFMAQGIRPATWWEKDRAKKATRIAIGLWVTLLVVLVGLILLLRKG
ncbi:MAG: TIGR00341 family protein [Sideroxydans sp.]|jgi:uncharacterized hydrophobic protein (TIGR00341 family)